MNIAKNYSMADDIGGGIWKDKQFQKLAERVYPMYDLDSYNGNTTDYLDDKRDNDLQRAAFIKGLQYNQQPKPLDDGQEGKGLPNFLVVKDSDDHYFIWPKNRYEKYVSEAVEVGATPAVKIVVGFNGDEDFLFPKPLPLADGEGEKVGTVEILEIIKEKVCDKGFNTDANKQADLYLFLVDKLVQLRDNKPVLPSGGVKDEIIKIQDEYIEFLDRESSPFISFAFTHNMVVSEKVVNEGKAYREKIANLKKQSEGQPAQGGAAT